MDVDVLAARERVDRSRKIYESSDFRALARARGRLSWLLCGATMAVYVGFFVVVALAPGALGHHVAGFASVGLLLIVVLFLVAFALVWAYLRVTTRTIVPTQERLATRYLAGEVAAQADEEARR